MLEPEKDKSCVGGPGVLCKNQKGQGSLNSHLPDVLTVKVIEIEKIIHLLDDDCTFHPFPSGTFFLIFHSSLLASFL